MNGIEKITARIEADALNTAAGIRESAAAEAEEIKNAFLKEAESVKKGILERGAVKAKEREEGLISLAQMETKKMVLAAKQEVMDAAFEMAAEKLRNMPKADKLAKLTELALKAVSTGEEKLVLGEKDKADFGKELISAVNAKLKEMGKTAKVELSDETADITGGLILKDKNVEVNCAYETLLRLNKKEIAGQVAKLLFA